MLAPFDIVSEPQEQKKLMLRSLSCASLANKKCKSLSYEELSTIQLLVSGQIGKFQISNYHNTLSQFEFNFNPCKE